MPKTQNLQEVLGSHSLYCVTPENAKDYLRTIMSSDENLDRAIREGFALFHLCLEKKEHHLYIQE